MISSKIIRFVAFVLMFYLAGCAGQPHFYDGEKLPPEKVSIIKGNVGLLPGSTTISISSVDGKSIKPYVNSVEVLPGVHVLGVHYYWHLAGGWSADGQITVDTQAGKTYQLSAKKNADGRTVTFSSSLAPTN